MELKLGRMENIVGTLVLLEKWKRSIERKDLVKYRKKDKLLLDHA
jgi:hypothetical protein